MRGLLQAFRGADGRSLGRAAAILYFVAATIAAFGNGASAGTAGHGDVLCITGADGKAPVQVPASGSHTQDCCLTGHSPTAGATPTGPVALPTRIGTVTIAAVETASGLPRSRLAGATSPRGPPFDA